MNRTASTDENLFPGWKRVVPPPPGYFHVLRRSFHTDLHVRIMVIKTPKGYRVKSCVEQDMLRGLDNWEGHVSTFPEVIGLVRETTHQWGDLPRPDNQAKAVPPAPFYYTDKNNQWMGPITRNELWGILEAGVIDWDTRVWDGDWVPILHALGFPPVP